MNKTIIAIFTILTLSLVYAIYMTIDQDIKQNKYMEEIHCKKVEYIPGNTGVSIGYNGKIGTVYTSGNTKYECDDNITIWK